MRCELSLATVLLGATIAIVQSVIAINSTVALQISEISDIAKRITGQIFLVREGRREKAGSAVIVGRDRSDYYVLTSRHVMNYPGDYQIKMSNEEFYYPLSPVGSREVAELGLRISPELDVTLLKFESQRSYPSAELDNKTPLAYGQEVYIFGYPSLISAPTHFTSGRITSLAPNDAKGYDVAYDNRVVPGTSGGPVLSQAGRVIGINGKAQTDPATGTLIAFGIPLSRFVTDRFIERFSVPIPNPVPASIAGFPKASCGDPNSGGSNTWYSVLINDTEANFRRVQAEYCRDAIRKDNGIQVASFLNVEKAREFASFMQNAVGSGRVGSPYVPSPPPRRNWNFPMATCGDRDPGGRNTWYPVFVNYSEARLRMIQTQYCRDAIRNYREKLGLHSIQIASFLKQEDAQAFADLMKRRIGSGEVGESSQFDARSATSGAGRR
ncbi:serine protease [Trichothermofontia sichuanensis B231]|uniref:S1 family peptidase n=1 Tax=Trichothermofontia sichuanensis TaxID=3045816 RepID=UPI002247897C|nr:serine protease [Trichothermofontia sichuanensis]UZQ53073.1 serine protease [Trichothermofontia sichuanensis B231]